MMRTSRIFHFVLAIYMVACAPEKGKQTDSDLPIPSKGEKPDFRSWKIEKGKFYQNGKWVFLKIAKPLRNFADGNAVQQLIDDLDTLKAKHFNTIELNCYWHHFDHDGDGRPDVSLAPLNKLINAVYAKGMYPCLSVETYAVGGGQIPAGFWERYPDAEAVDDKGNRVNDTEYGFGSKVVSIFHPGYREVVRTFIKSLAAAVDHEKLLYFETTVEPQYMGTISLCYSEQARKSYTSWLKEQGVTDPAAQMPASFPMPQSFVENGQWNRFRAQFLAKWVNEDARAYKEVAGNGAYIAVDYLDADEGSMINRQGNPEEFLANLTVPNVIQLNWHWYFPANAPNQKAYDRVKHTMQQHARDWAVTEHMTFNGSDYNHFTDDELNQILTNTLTQGTRFGWEFVSVDNTTTGSFDLYNDDWSPKRVMSFVDDRWNFWLQKAKEIEDNSL